MPSKDKDKENDYIRWKYVLYQNSNSIKNIILDFSTNFEHQKRLLHTLKVCTLPIFKWYKKIQSGWLSKKSKSWFTLLQQANVLTQCTSKVPIKCRKFQTSKTILKTKLNTIHTMKVCPRQNINDLHTESMYFTCSNYMKNIQPWFTWFTNSKWPHYPANVQDTMHMKLNS